MERNEIISNGSSISFLFEKRCFMEVIVPCFFFGGGSGGWENGANTKNIQFVWVNEASFQIVSISKIS